MSTVKGYLRQLLPIGWGALILSFTLSYIHTQSQITEGGVLGLILLLQHHFDLSPAGVSLVLNAGCYILAIKALGRRFFRRSIIGAVCLALGFQLWQLLPIELHWLSQHPVAAAILGGLGVGLGAGLVLRQNASTSGDDALALGIARLSGLRIGLIYLLGDIIILGLSLSYIPLRLIVFSLLSVIISSFTVERLAKAMLPKLKKAASLVRSRPIPSPRANSRLVEERE